MKLRERLSNAYENCRERILKFRLAISSSLSKRELLSDSGLHEEFQRSRGEIERIFTETEYYHGTGALHCPGKYDGRSGEITDSLASFLTDGINPQDDFYNELFQTGVEKSISLTKVRPYARLYASAYMHEKEDLKYKYGSRLFWFSLIGIRTLKKCVTDIDLIKEKFNSLKERFSPKTRRQYLEKKKERKEKASKWTHSFRTDDKYNKRPVSAMTIAKSDIEGNYPVVFGIKPDVVKPLPIKYRAVTLYEARNANVLTPNQYTHLQVPLSQVAEVRKKIQDLGVKIPVIPIEFVELINSETSISELTKPH